MFRKTLRHDVLVSIAAMPILALFRAKNELIKKEGNCSGRSYGRVAIPQIDVSGLLLKHSFLLIDSSDRRREPRGVNSGSTYRRHCP